MAARPSGPPPKLKDSTKPAQPSVAELGRRFDALRTEQDIPRRRDRPEVRLRVASITRFEKHGKASADLLRGDSTGVANRPDPA